MIINSPLSFTSIFLGIIFALKLFREEIAGQTFPIKGGGKMKNHLACDKGAAYVVWAANDGSDMEMAIYYSIIH